MSKVSSCYACDLQKGVLRKKEIAAFVLYEKHIIQLTKAYKSVLQISVSYF